MPTSADRPFALDAVLAACHLARGVQERLVTDSAMTKRDRSPVTVADFAVQALIADRLRSYAAADRLMAEENAGALGTDEAAAVRALLVDELRRVGSGLTIEGALSAIDRGDHDGEADRYWILDPIDGTKGFLRRDQYAIALALVEGDEVVLGALGCPNLAHGEADGVVYLASRGDGTVAHDLSGSSLGPIRTAGATDPRDAVLVESVESGHSSHGASAEIARRLGVRNEPVRIDSQCKYAVVARGDASVYLRLPTRPGYREKVWDHAAGSIVVEEAGGRVSDLAGDPLDLVSGPHVGNPAGFVVTNGPLHGPFRRTASEVVSGG